MAKYHLQVWHIRFNQHAYQIKSHFLIFTLRERFVPWQTWARAENISKSYSKEAYRDWWYKTKGVVLYKLLTILSRFLRGSKSIMNVAKLSLICLGMPATPRILLPSFFTLHQSDSPVETVSLKRNEPLESIWGMVPSCCISTVGLPMNLFTSERVSPVDKSLTYWSSIILIGAKGSICWFKCWVLLIAISKNDAAGLSLKLTVLKPNMRHYFLESPYL